jgi:hypothetical protein
MSDSKFQLWLDKNIIPDDKSAFLVFYKSEYAGGILEDYHAIFVNYTDALAYADLLKMRIEKNSIIKDQEKLTLEFRDSGYSSQEEFIEFIYGDSDSIEIEIWNKQNELIYWTGGFFCYDDIDGFYVSWND